MPRKSRVILSGFCYHVMLRGNNGEIIFREDSDRVKFCLLLQYAIEKHNFIVHGFCLMNNHVHLLVETKNADLYRGIHAFAFQYAQYFNKKYQRKGHLFQGRYKAIIVQHDGYLNRLVRYIHRNPVRAGIVRNPAEYLWSSHRAYLEKTVYTWLTQDLILSLFSEIIQKETSLENSRAALEKYISMNDEDAKEHLSEIRLSAKLGAYGNPEFIKTFGNPNSENIHRLSFCKVRSKVVLSDLIQITCNHFDLSKKDLCSSSRKANIVQAREMLSLLVTKLNVATLSELSSELFRNHSSLSRSRQKAKSNSNMIHLVDQIIAKLNDEKG